MTSKLATDFLSRARELQPLLRGESDQIESARRLTPPVVAALGESGLFSLLVPRELGGGEADVATALETYEIISRADASAGWCVMIAGTTGITAAQLPRDGAEEIFGDPRVATGGVLFPRGAAIPVEGGYRVTARWPFGSGSGHAKWLLGGSLVSPTEGSDERPQARMFFFPREEVTIHDTWQVSGLRGTGSNDFEVTGQFVPARRTCPIGGGKVWASGPLYRFPLYGLLALGVASVSLGIARAAIDELHELATAKTPTGSTRLLAERASAQSGLAEAEALLRSAGAFMRETVASAQARAESGDRLTLNERALLRLSATTAAQNCARAVDICYNLGGASSIYAQNPLQRHFRDVHTVTQHVMVGQPTLEVAGRVFMDIPTDTTMF